jgi:hypothetical protein
MFGSQLGKDQLGRFELGAVDASSSSSVNTVMIGQVTVTPRWDEVITVATVLKGVVNNGQ